MKVPEDVADHVIKCTDLMGEYIRTLKTEDKIKTLGFVGLSLLELVINKDPKGASQFARHILSFAPNSNPLISKHNDSMLAGALDDVLNNPEVFAQMNKIFGNTVTH